MTVRTALVLAGGGFLGAAWMAGALSALQSRVSFPLGETDLVVGTSAGSVLAAGLRLGVTAEHMSDFMIGSANTLERYPCGRAFPAWPCPRMGSPRLLVRSLSVRGIQPWAAFCASLPQGRTSLEPLGDLIRSMHQPDRFWPSPGQTWIMAVDYDSGRQVAFGRPGAPSASLSEAVVASCSLPGWFAPVRIGERRYVDGGIRSVTSADLLIGSPPERAYVLAPVIGATAGCARTPWQWAERRVRRILAAAARREVDQLRAAGTKVTLLTPQPEDLAVIGWNLMDSARRDAVLMTSLRTSALLADESVA